jgi:hypothetical protein
MKSVWSATFDRSFIVQRMTPFGVLDVSNKNTGDSHGDTSFVLSKKTNAYTCRQDPNSFQCSGLARA